ncbi:hypothetical protein NQ317_002815 [Molorchus minor]|uniref:Leucine zipper with capping helix domain-containing protein n=1 Tax=Molorchus minor TaxID=1323400 RepID=A0ABQ9JML6_9CUCU|nr:hypothetical protein NQ317_002815 [Molorchus minor]
MKKELEKCPFTIEICPKEKIETEKGYERYLDQYRKRKRMCMDILDSILENYPKSKKHLFDEIGIETDEDAGFSVK